MVLCLSLPAETKRKKRKQILDQKLQTMKTGKNRRCKVSRARYHIEDA